MKKLIIVCSIFCLPSILIAQVDDVTYHQHIAPILQEHCTPCHQPGQIGPMPLTNYKEVSAFGTMIQYVTKEKLMPPWRALPNSIRFHNENQISDEEIALIASWVNQGLRKGKTISTPDTISTSSFEFDTTISMAQSFEQYGVYYDQYRVFVLPTNFKEDKYVSGIKFQPGNSRIVRNCQISLELNDGQEILDQWDPQYGYFSFGTIGFAPSAMRWFNWSAGDQPEQLSGEFVKRIPQGAKLLVHIHYGPSNVPVLDSSRLQLKFASSNPIQKEIQTLPIFTPNEITNPPFRIPADSLRRFHSKITLPAGIHLRSIFPQSHFLGRKWEIFVKMPDNNTLSLLKIDDWDFKWKRNYVFQQPIFLPKGSTIHALATYDNTSKNLLNPNEPSREMKTGRRMFEENYLVFMEFALAENSSENRTNYFPSMLSPNEFKKTISQSYTNSFRFKLTPFTNENEPLEFSFQEMINAEISNGNYLLEIKSIEDNNTVKRFIGIWNDQVFE